jgi:hypothetical protein
MSTLTLTGIEEGTGSFFPIGLALLEELIERAAQYSSAHRTEIFQAAISFCYIPMLQAEVEAMNAAGGFDLDRARHARREGRMFGEANLEREQQLIGVLLRMNDSDAFSGRVYYPTESLYSNLHFRVSEAQVALRDARELVASLSSKAEDRKALISRALVFAKRDHAQPNGALYGLMMLILASIADLLYGSSPELDELFTGNERLVAMGPVYLSPGELRAKAGDYAKAIINRIHG